MKKAVLIKTSFIVAMLLVLTGELLQVQHYQNASTLLFSGLAFQLIFTVLVVHEVNTSRKIDSADKTFWTMGFILVSGVAGLVYLLKARKNIAEE